MSETRWTPGPWWADPEFDETDRVYVVIAANPNAGPMPGNPTRGSVALAVRHATMPVDECRANANLIAAAPDLYEALAAAVATIERDRLLWSGFPQQRKDDWELMLSEMKAALKKARGAQP